MKNQPPGNEPDGTPPEPEIDRQFELLRGEMQRVLSGAPGAADQADRPHTTPSPSPDAALSDTASIAALQQRLERASSSADQQISRLVALRQRDAAALDALAGRVAALERRRLRGFLGPIAVVILLAVILGIGFLGEEGGPPALLSATGEAIGTLWDRIKAATSRPTPVAVAPATGPAAQLPTPVPATPPAAETTPAPKANTEADAQTSGAPAAPSAAAPQPMAPSVATASPPPAPAEPETRPPPVDQAASQPVPQTVAPQTVAPQTVAPQTITPQGAMPQTVTPEAVASPPAPANPPAEAAPVEAATEKAPPPLGAPSNSPIVLRASSDTWVLVRNSQKVVLLERLMRSGDAWDVPNEPGLTLTTGNAGGLTVLIGGVASPSLGPVGAVRRDVPLDPASLRAGPSAPASAPPAGTHPTGRDGG